MGKTILKTDIKRESGFLYYCGTDKDGNITIGQAVMSRGGRKKKKSSKKSTKKKAKK